MDMDLAIKIGLEGTLERTNISLPFAFYAEYPDLRDLVSGDLPSVIFDAGRRNADGDEFGANVAVTDSNSVHAGPGAYAQLIKKSEDISDGVWVKARASTETNVIIAPDGELSGDKLIADATADASHLIFQLLTAADNTIYTYSIYLKKGDFNWGRVSAKKKNGADASAFFDVDNGVIGVTSGATATIESVGNGWYRCTISYDVLSGGTAADVRVYISEADNDFILSGSVTGQGIYAWGGQVTQSPYRLAYAPNDSAVATVTVPLNYADASHGIKYEIKDDLLDALDGVADGSELWDETTFLPYGGQTTYDPVTSIYHIDSDGIDTGARDLTLLAINTYYEVSIEVTEVSTGGINIEIGENTHIIGSPTVKTYTTRLNSGSQSDCRVKRVSGVTDVKFKVLHIKQISPAQGRMTIPITFMFDAGVVGGDINILDIDGTGNWLILDDTNNLLKVTDGTNTATIALSQVAGTEYVIDLNYGGTLGQKMRLSLDGVSGTAVTMKDTFSPGATLNLGWEAEWFKLDEIIIKPDPIWDLAPVGNPPSGVWVVDGNGDYLIDSNGNFIYA